MSQIPNHNKIEIKIITLGDSQVGKSSLIFRYIENKFSNNYITTMGFDIKNKQITLRDGTEAKLMIFDTAGQERFRSLAQNYIKKANCALLIYDISQRDTFENIEKWLGNIKDVGEEMPIILIGNKSDLNDKRLVPFEEGKKKAEEYGYPFFETSCKTGEHVSECFIELAELVYEKIGIKLIEKSHTILKKNIPKSKKKKCC